MQYFTNINLTVPNHILNFTKWVVWMFMCVLSTAGFDMAKAQTLLYIDNETMSLVTGILRISIYISYLY